MEQHDVVVIGAGLVGCAAALHLARFGLRVGVFDADELNRGASGRNAGSLHFQLEPRMAAALREQPELLGPLVPLNLAAQRDWHELPGELASDLELRMGGGLILAEKAEHLALLEQKRVVEREQGLDTELLSRSDLRRVAPYLSDKILAAAFCELEGHANPRLVTPAFARAAAAAGARFSLGTRVSGLEGSLSGWCLRLESRGETRQISARKVLIAAGAWSTFFLELVGIALPLQPVGLSMVVTEKAGPVVPHLIQHMGRRLSLKQVTDGNLLIGGSWPSQLLKDDHTPGSLFAGQIGDSLVGSLQVACDVVPAVSQLLILRGWTGVASDTPDHMPLVGEVPGRAGLYLAAGASTFTLGPTVARGIAEMIADRTLTAPVQSLDPGRFARQAA